MNSTLDSRNPKAVRVMSTLDSRNPKALELNRDPRVYSVDTPYAEYPKWVKFPSGGGIVVNDADEERVARGELDAEGNETVGEAASGDAAPDPTVQNNVVVSNVPRRGPPSKAEREARRAEAEAQIKGA